jgi:hypothetical protein
MTTELRHPHWCARNHRCTVSRLDGIHLSDPITFRTTGSRVSTVVTLSQRPTERTPAVEVRIMARLTATEEAHQARQIQRVLTRLVNAMKEITQ